MRPSLPLAVAHLLLLLLVGLPSSAAVPQEAELTASARQVVEFMAKGHYSAVEARFEASVRPMVTAQRLEAAWGSLLNDAGAFRSQGETRLERGTAGTAVYVTCTFDREVLLAKVVFTPGGELAGLFFQPVLAPKPLGPAPYVRPESFVEREVSVGSGRWALPATLSVPKGAGPFPAVVLVHGSGPLDRDETLGPNKPFRDLAWGLASQGIVVLRYDKRTFAHGDLLHPVPPNFTVKDETEDDALAAAALLRGTPGVNPAKVFLLGHSLGAELAPRIAERDPNLAGLILLAPSTEKSEEALLRQTAYLLSQGGASPADQQKKLEEVRKAFVPLRQPSKSLPPDTAIMGVPIGYWRDLDAYDPLAAARKLAIPMFFLQGGRDYQVLPKEMAAFQAALSGRREVTFKLYPKLNHLFIAGEGLSGPKDYAVPGHVDQEVVDDVAAWILSH
jgi:dienelactone hydrolase